MAGRKKKTTPVLGDDPLSWMGKEEPTHEQQAAKTIQTDAHDDATVVAQTASSSVDVTKEPALITLEPILTLSEVSQLKDTLQNYAGVDEVRIDASNVEHIDTAGLQLLLALSKAIQKNGGKVHWSGWSSAYAGTAELLGLSVEAGIKES